MNKKIFGAIMFFIALMAVSVVSAIPVIVDEVKLDGNTLDPDDINEITALERDNSFEVKVKLRATDDVEDVQIQVYLRGYDHDDLISDISDVFDMDVNNTKWKTFNLNFPYRMDKDNYQLRIIIEDRNSAFPEYLTYNLNVESSRHDMKIKDVVFSPSNAVVAGRSLLTSIRLKNVGMKDDVEGVKVTFEIPELNLIAIDYIDEIEEDDAVTSEELYLRIPECTEPGTYDAFVSIEYDDGDEVETMSRQITILEGDLCEEQEKDEETPVQPKTIITVGPTTQDVVVGQGGVFYPLTISNAGSAARTYVVSADGFANWADISISPANIVTLQSGEASALYVYVSAKADAAPGEHMFSLTVTSGDEILKQFPLKANVVEGEEEVPAATNWSSVKRVLEIGLVVLVVLLVILGLIIGFSRLKGNDDDFEDDEGKSETYY